MITNLVASAAIRHCSMDTNPAEMVGAAATTAMVTDMAATTAAITVDTTATRHLAGLAATGVEVIFQRRDITTTAGGRLNLKVSTLQSHNT